MFADLYKKKILALESKIKIYRIQICDLFPFPLIVRRKQKRSEVWLIKVKIEYKDNENLNIKETKILI